MKKIESFLKAAASGRLPAMSNRCARRSSLAAHISPRRNQRGYILLTLMLFVALLAVASLAWIEKVDFQIKRDREEELIHRGVQYSRAIRRYVKKFGRYPSRIEDLENTNNIHFLRKRYKDPITGKDFKLLRMTDVQISFSPGAASGLAPGLTGAADASAIQGGAPGGLNANTAVAQGGPGPSSIPGNPQDSQQVAPQAGTTTNDNSDSQQTAQDQSGQTPQLPGTSSNRSAQGGFGGPTFGGLPIVGVASTSKEKSIRQFNKKDHYNQWQFIYDPSSDRGGLLTTPNQPPLTNAQSVQQQNGQPGTNGQNSGFGTGQPGGFGQQSNFGQQPGGVNPPQQPPDNSQQPNQ